MSSQVINLSSEFACSNTFAMGFALSDCKLNSDGKFRLFTEPKITDLLERVRTWNWQVSSRLCHQSAGCPVRHLPGLSGVFGGCAETFRGSPSTWLPVWARSRSLSESLGTVGTSGRCSLAVHLFFTVNHLFIHFCFPNVQCSGL